MKNKTFIQSFHSRKYFIYVWNSFPWSYIQTDISRKGSNMRGQYIKYLIYIYKFQI